MVFCISIAGAKEISVVEGSYVGWKAIPDMTLDDEKSYPSYELHKLSIKGRAITISTATRTMKDRVAWSSASGPFKTIKGSFYYKGTKLRVKMQIKSADYLGRPKNGWPVMDYEVTVNDHTKIIFGGVTYTLND